MNWIAHLLGAFYVFAGLMALRFIARDRLLDEAIARIACKKPPATEDRQIRFLHICALLTLASGLALATLSRWSSALFIANTLFQAGYLLWARKVVPPADEEERAGRKSTTRAFVLYAVVTVGVVLLARQGVLTGWTFLPSTLHSSWIEALGLAAVVAIFEFRHRRSANLPSTPSSSEPFEDTADFEPQDPPLPDPSQTLRLAPEYGCWPLWNHDTGDNVEPNLLPLPSDLLARLADWDALYQSTYNSDDPVRSGFQSAEDENRFHAEAETLKAELTKVWSGGVVLTLPRRSW